jgi:histidyl-tRNA synthetase
MGLERMIALLREAATAPEHHLPHAYFVIVGGDRVVAAGLGLAERWREAEPRLRLQANCGGGSFKAQLKRADRSGARYALILAEAELEAGEVLVKDLRNADTPQVRLPADEVPGRLGI